MLDLILSYLAHLGSALALIVIFMTIYIKATPYNELELIRAGNTAAICSLGGAVIGFCLTLHSSLIHNDSIDKFLVWSLMAMVVQVVTFFLVFGCFKNVKQEIEDNNIAMGALIGVVSLSVGIVNAACLS